jgi:cell division septum initiation protein DivIVA
MTDRELRRLNRSALIELLIEQTQINENLEAKVSKLEKRLKSKTIAVSTAGSMADAAMELNNVFASADRAAEQYLDNLREATQRSDELLAEARRQAEQILADAYAEADAIRSQGGMSRPAAPVQLPTSAPQPAAERSDSFELELLPVRSERSAELKAPRESSRQKSAARTERSAPPARTPQKKKAPQSADKKPTQKRVKSPRPETVDDLFESAFVEMRKNNR